jgi:hypothetical protein
MSPSLGRPDAGASAARARPHWTHVIGCLEAGFRQWVTAHDRSFPAVLARMWHGRLVVPSSALGPMFLRSGLLPVPGGFWESVTADAKREGWAWIR